MGERTGTHGLLIFASGVLGIVIFGCVVGQRGRPDAEKAACAGLTVLYETDFSSDPGWITNDRGNMYWDAEAKAYHVKSWDGGNRHASVSVEVPAVGRLRLEYDVYVLRMDWAGDVRFGLSDSDMDLTSTNFWLVNHSRGDLGRGASLWSCDSAGNGGPATYWNFYDLYTWYRNEIVWDTDAGTLSWTMTRLSDDFVFPTQVFSSAGTFHGIDRIFAGGVGDNYAPEAVGEAYIDNVRLSREAPSGPGGLIVFEARRSDLDRSIYYCRPEGSGLTEVVSSATVVQPSRPAWFPDGEFMAFDAGPAHDNDIWVVRRDGTGLTKLTNTGGGLVHPHVSPDGTKIAFSTIRYSLYLMNTDGTGVTYMCPGVHPRWSPDGSKILFSNWGIDYDSDLFVLDPDSGAVSQLTNTPGISETLGDWSPDGARIAFEVHPHSVIDSDIWVMDADGSDRVNLTGSWNGAAVDETPAWSPDGKYVAFASDYSGNFDIWVMEADRSGLPQRVTHTSIDKYNPDWALCVERVSILGVDAER